MVKEDFLFPEENPISRSLKEILDGEFGEESYIQNSKYEMQCAIPGAYIWKRDGYYLSEYINYSIYPPKIRDQVGLRNLSNRELGILKGFPDSQLWKPVDYKAMYQAIWRSADVDVCGLIAEQIKKYLSQMGQSKSDDWTEAKECVLYGEKEKDVERRFDVFVSSTYEDLIEERKEVTQAILECDCMPVGMEMFPASNLEQWKFIKKVIEKSDFYLIIAAGKYGSIGINEAGERMSYTEMEFDYAQSIGKPILAFIVKDITELKSRKVDLDEETRAARDRFLKKVKSGRVVNFYVSKEDLKAKVLLGVTNLKKQFNTGGWIREVEAVMGASDSLKRRVQTLETENMQLKKQISQEESNIKKEQTEREKSEKKLLQLQQVIDDFQEKVEELRSMN